MKHYLLNNLININIWERLLFYLSILWCIIYFFIEIYKSKSFIGFYDTKYNFYIFIIFIIIGLLYYILDIIYY